MSPEDSKRHHNAVQEHFAGAHGKWRERYDAPSALADHMFLRRAALAAALLEKVAGSGGQRLLDLGCGAGIQAAAAARAGWRVTGLDLTRTMIDPTSQAGSGPFWVVGAAEDLPFRSRQFDAVLMLGVLSYTREPNATLREVGRHLRRGGHIVISWSSQASVFARLDWALTYLPQRAWRAVRPSPSNRRPPAPADEAAFLRQYQHRWNARVFRKLLAAGGFHLLEQHGFDFGNFRILGRAVWSTATAVAISRGLEAVSGLPGLRWLQRGAKLHIALAVLTDDPGHG